MGIVWLGAAKLVVRYAGPKRAVGKVLQLATPSVVADKNVKLAIGSEPDYATIMIAALDRIGGILLKRVEPDDIPIQRQSRTVPNEAVHSVSEQRSLAEHRSIIAGCALRPVQVNARVGRKLRMECDSQKPPLRTKVDRQIQHRALYRSIHHPLHLSRFLLEHEDVIVAKKCHGGWAIETADNCSYFQSRIYHCWLRPDSFAVDKDHN